MANTPTGPLWAQKHIDDTVTARKATHQKLEEESVENRKAYERFYNSLALFSGGTIALSITYLGYLKSIPNKTVMYPKTLITSWLVLLICLIASLFYSFFNTHYIYFSRVREYLEKVIDQKETQLEEMDKLPLDNTPEQLQGAKKRFGMEAELFKGKRTFSKTREEVYMWLWIWSGRVARFAFPLGLGMLIFFAIKNM
jgi:hypothetical protein